MKNRWLFFIVLLLFSCTDKKDTPESLIRFIPENSLTVIRSNSFKTIETNLKNNGFAALFSEAPFFEYFTKNLSYTTHIHPASEVLLTLNLTNDTVLNHTLITRAKPHLFSTDSILNKTVETLTFENWSYQKFTLHEQVLYSMVADSVFVMSSSEEIIRESFQKKPFKDSIFSKIYSLGEAQPLTVYVNGTLFSGFLNNAFSEAISHEAFFNWMTLDVHTQPDILKFSGIALSADTGELAGAFNNTLPQKNQLAYVTPTSASGFVSYTFDDYDTFAENLKPFQIQDTLPPLNTSFFTSLNEVGIIYAQDEKIVACSVIDPLIAAENMQYYWNEHSTFREIPIKKITDSILFNRAFNPLIQNSAINYGAQIDHFFVFTENENTLHEIITEYLNENSLKFRPYYEEHMAHLSTEASVLWVALSENFKEVLYQKSKPNHQSWLHKLHLSDFPMTAIQLVSDGNFAHVNAVVKETKRSSRSTGVNQSFSLRLESNIAGDPQFFSNHLTKGKDIVVQDTSDKLYLISASGKILWSKPLDGKIQGDIHEVDLLKNGRIQLAFTTSNTFYVLDRNGKEVKPFPLKLKDEITQPLAVFDYDNNRNYRFVITQESQLLMYDSKAKIVKGFTFTKAPSKIVLPPQHIRLGNKDYLLVAEESGKLNFLTRTGQQRIPLNDTFDFGNSPFYAEGNHFSFIDATNQKINISQNGKVEIENLNDTGEVFMATRGKTNVLLSNNVLYINNHRVELPYGDYYPPVISVSNNRILISITNRQEQRVYAYNSLGELLPGFPIYGTSAMEFADASADGRPEGIVKGADNEVIIYELN